MKTSINDLTTDQLNTLAALGQGWEQHGRYYWKDDEPHIMSLLNETPKQSLHDHDLQVAERVREACTQVCGLSGACSCVDNIYDLDLAEVIK